MVLRRAEDEHPLARWERDVAELAAGAIAVLRRARIAAQPAHRTNPGARMNNGPDRAVQPDRRRTRIGAIMRVGDRCGWRRCRTRLGAVGWQRRHGLKWLDGGTGAIGIGTRQVRTSCPAGGLLCGSCPRDTPEHPVLVPVRDGTLIVPGRRSRSIPARATDLTATRYPMTHPGILGPRARLRRRLELRDHARRRRDHRFTTNADGTPTVVRRRADGGDRRPCGNDRTRGPARLAAFKRSHRPTELAPDVRSAPKALDKNEMRGYVLPPGDASCRRIRSSGRSSPRWTLRRGRRTPGGHALAGGNGGGHHDALAAAGKRRRTLDKRRDRVQP